MPLYCFNDVLQAELEEEERFDVVKFSAGIWSPTRRMAGTVNGWARWKASLVRLV